MTSILGTQSIQHPNGTAAASINSSGVVTFNSTPNLSSGSMSNAPAFKATKSTSQTISANSWQKVEFDSELLDTDNCYDNSTNYRFTPNVAGKYWIYCNLYSGTPNTHIYSAITFNGTRTLAGNIDGSQAGNVFLANIFTFNGSSDYVEVQSYQGTSNGDISTTEQFSVFGGYKLIGI
tara:strand:- start:3120 stop:3653 length:534 start_codon:yes stop_codon:yes gene_type:complete